ncbi:MAG: ABC transporter ATP-binding protein [Acidobacteriota bacterium]|nr:ABC transporter ATP-binding protein [Acidobacteriota bacterium]
MNEYEINLKEVSLAYGNTEVVHRVSFGIKRGVFAGLVGPNGSGKSTIIKSLSRILEPVYGQISLRGQNIKNMKQKDLARLLAVVPQNAVVPSLFSAFEIVLMGRNPHKGFLSYEDEKDMSIVRDAMEKTDTWRFRDRRIHELSGGEIQSVVIARALTQDTDIIVLDEPTAALDVARQIEILNFLRGHCKERNKTIIAAIHDLNLAAHYCDRMILLKKGDVFMNDAPSKVITNENLSEVYGSGSYVYPHPLSGLPAVLPMVEGIFHSQEVIANLSDCAPSGLWLFWYLFRRALPRAIDQRLSAFIYAYFRAESP